MRPAFLHLLKAWLATLAVLQATLAAGVPLGLSLCFGCDGPDGAGWSIAAPCESAPAESSCCAAEIPDSEDPAAAPIPASSDCGCIDLPLPVGLPENALPAAREDTGAIRVAVSLLPPACGGWMSAEGASIADRLRATRALAPHDAAALRALTPFERRTVFIV